MTDPLVGRTVEVDGRRVHFHVRGDGPPVVLLHGLGSLAEEILPAFTATLPGRRLFAFDRPGYGFSDPLPEAEAGADGQADWLAGVLSALGLSRITLVAHSIGAGPALAFAARHPGRLAGVLLVAPFCRPTPHAPMPLLRAAIAPVIGPVMRTAVVPLIAPLIGPGILAAALKPNEVPDYLADFPFVHAGRDSAILAMAAELLAFNDAMAAVAPILAGGGVPMAVVAGEADEIAEPAWHLAWLSGVLPDARVETLPGVGHAPHHADPPAVAAALARIGVP
ncbi:alpha/beta fold hydrolase [Chthonobacter rhizosphaerae]|uniref:alpha/beta fold hydrolase n=1 Tax=Chthonobacter rhizosphaerae TaxID=2735553 RepID=UPI0015EEEA90|nr:alpha/beta fold hydrolase [Chthonobacter rhizosphaerae]